MYETFMYDFYGFDWPLFTYLLIYLAMAVSLTLHNMQISKQSIPYRLYSLEDKHEW